ncbi:hypothetical protein EV421DRAFT_1735533 [Armillaria borealis]|uniref:Protein kinase domain-containing protein n=1 Tax=Armillaria borealis TaxID=47425 RepID=A0AA39MRQ6_9AGAR|nr:hypothetical protein EV421DRAFT_1735533 [Armillaria borealis]
MSRPYHPIVHFKLSMGPRVAEKQRALPVLVSLLSSWSNTEVKHRLLADAGLAPKLLYHGPLDSSTDAPSYGSLRMVVMEEAEGTNAFVLYQDREALDLFLTSVRELHAYGFVFGDLRRQNIMVSPGGKVKLIDFDWAGKDGEAMYPIRMSNKIRWAPGVGAMEKMYKAHDNFMIDRLVGRLDIGEHRYHERSLQEARQPSMRLVEDVGSGFGPVRLRTRHFEARRLRESTRDTVSYLVIVPSISYAIMIYASITHPNAIIGTSNILLRGLDAPDTIYDDGRPGANGNNYCLHDLITTRVDLVTTSKRVNPLLEALRLCFASTIELPLHRRQRYIPCLIPWRFLQLDWDRPIGCIEGVISKRESFLPADNFSVGQTVSSLFKFRSPRSHVLHTSASNLDK